MSNAPAGGWKRGRSATAAAASVEGGHRQAQCSICGLLSWSCVILVAVTIIDLPDDAYRLASVEARAAGMDIRDWIAVAISARARGDIPVDDGGFPAYIPRQQTEEQESALPLVGG